MKIIFSDHAKKQLTERKIPKKLILETVKNPQKKIKSFKNRELRQNKFGDKIFRSSNHSGRKFYHNYYTILA